MEEQKTEIVFADGIFFNKPHENAPDFVKGSVSFADVDKAIAFLQKHKVNNKVTLDLLKSKKEGGGLYFKLNTYVPPVREEKINSEDVPW